MLKETPAAKQMIMNYINTSGGSDNAVHTAWQTELTNLGYPSQNGIRNIAISNGSECGQPQDVAPTNLLFQFDSTNQLDPGGDALDWGLGFLSLFSGHPRWSALIPADTKYTSHFQVNASATNGGTQVYTGHVSWSKHIFFFNINGTLTDDKRMGHQDFWHTILLAEVIFLSARKICPYQQVALLLLVRTTFVPYLRQAR